MTMNKRDTLKKLLSQCNDEEQYMFKRMYSHEKMHLSINDAVDRMADDKIDTAISQAQRTIQKKDIIDFNLDN